MVGYLRFYYTDIQRYSSEIDAFINRQLYLSLAKMGWKFTASSLGKLPHKILDIRMKVPNVFLFCKEKILAFHFVWSW